MRVQRFTNDLLQYRWITVALTFLVTCIPVLGVIGIVFAGLVTLRKGIVEGAIMTLAATLPYVIGFYISSAHGTETALVLWAGVGVAVISNLLTWVFAGMLWRHATWSQILQVAALMGVLFVSVTHLVYPDVADWWGNQLQSLQSYYNEMAPLTGVLKADTSKLTDTQMESINLSKQYATGIMTMVILLNALFQVIVARWWQSIVYSPGMLRRELHNIRLSHLAGFLFVLSLVLSYLGNSVVLDIMPILNVLFGAAGLSLIHYIFALMKSATRWFWLWLMYITLIFALPTSLMLIALMGLFDVWLDIRKRLKKS